MNAERVHWRRAAVVVRGTVLLVRWRTARPIVVDFGESVSKEANDER